MKLQLLVQLPLLLAKPLSNLIQDPAQPVDQTTLGGEEGASGEDKEASGENKEASGKDKEASGEKA